MNLYAVIVNLDDTVRVVSRDVVKETPQFYFITRGGHDMPWNERNAFGYSERISKVVAHTTPQASVRAYMTRRQRDKETARAVVAQATKQIASASEALQALGDYGSSIPPDPPEVHK